MISNTITEPMTNDLQHYHIILVGCSGVGKTQIVNAWQESGFDDEPEPTREVAVSHVYGPGNSCHPIDVYDTPGSLNASLPAIKNLGLAVIVFDLANQPSKEAIPHWCSKIREAYPQTDIMLVGNKRDLGSVNVYFEDHIREACEQYNPLGVEYVSALSEEGIDDLIANITSYLTKGVETYARRQIKPYKGKGLVRATSLDMETVDDDDLTVEQPYPQDGVSTKQHNTECQQIILALLDANAGLNMIGQESKYLQAQNEIYQVQEAIDRLVGRLFELKHYSDG